MKVSFFPHNLWRQSWRYLAKNRWQSALMVLGIAIGVAVVVAIDIANTSAARAFDLSKEAVAGKATHQIVAGPDGIDDAFYTRLRRDGIVQQAAPIIDTYVSSPQMGSRPFELLGIDPFADGDFRQYLSQGQTIPIEQLIAFLTRPGAILVSNETASRYQLSLGSSLTLEIAGKQQLVFVAGILEPADALSRQTLEGMIITDIATAQEITGRLGSLDRIDLILPPDSQRQVIQQIEGILPQGYQVVSTASRSASINQMTEAFRLNLSALSLLALMVGLFLIYNTMTFSVVRRRTLYGLLRCLGVTRREIISMVLVEAFVVGVLGSALGIGLGILMGRQTVHMVTQTINDLYYTTTVQAVGIPPASLLKGGILGVIATGLTALFPALEASSVPARLALSRSGLERKARYIVFWLAGAGILLIGLGQGFFLIPGSSLFLGFGGTVATLLGFAMESAVALIFLMVLVRPVMGKTLGMLGKMAPSNLVSNLSRTSVAVASLMVAVAVVVGMTLMISSFRSSVETWLKETLQGDIYISTPSFIQTGSSEAIDPAVISMVEAESGALRVDTLRTVRVDAQQGPVTLNATENPDFGVERLYRQLSIPKDQVWDRLNLGEVLVTEALANRFDLYQPGSQVTLMSAAGWRTFPVMGIIYEYTSSEGSIWMAESVYRDYWNDSGQNSISLRLADGVDVNQEVTYLQDTLSAIQQLNIRSNVTLRSDVMQVFDRTFAITNAMRLLATIVAFIGVLNTSMLLQMEKQRELGILRALGLTKLQLWKLVLLESGLMGLVSGFLAAPTGYMLAVILVDVINKRSFNWTLHLLPTPWVFGQGWIIAIIAAILAGIYPAWRLNQMAAADAIRYE